MGTRRRAARAPCERDHRSTFAADAVMGMTFFGDQSHKTLSSFASFDVSLANKLTRQRLSAGSVAPVNSKKS